MGKEKETYYEKHNNEQNNEYEKHCSIHERYVYATVPCYAKKCQAVPRCSDDGVIKEAPKEPYIE